MCVLLSGKCPHSTLLLTAEELSCNFRVRIPLRHPLLACALHQPHTVCTQPTRKDTMLPVRAVRWRSCCLLYQRAQSSVATKANSILGRACAYSRRRGVLLASDGIVGEASGRRRSRGPASEPHGEERDRPQDRPSLRYRCGKQRAEELMS